MSLLTGVASKDFKTYEYDADDSIVMSWKFRYILRMPRHEAIRHFGTVGMMQIYFAKAIEVNAGRLEYEGIDRAMFEVVTENGHPEFKIIKDSINVNQIDEVK